MTLKLVEINHTNKFLVEEIPKSVGLLYVSVRIKKYFDIKPKNGDWVFRKKK